MPSELHPASAFHAPQTITRNEFKNALTQAVGYSAPSAASKRYRRVRVLLVQWENDTLGVEHEILGLKQIFTSHYGYSAHIAKIPSATRGPPIHWLNRVMMEVTTDMTDQDLIIFYYGGHATYDPHDLSLHFGGGGPCVFT